MISLLSCIISLLKGRQFHSFPNIYNIPWPRVMHQTLQEEFIRNFKDVFIIGDVHGCYDELIELLNKAGVSDDTSLKIFVGDLVNKGPKNREVLQLLRNSKSMLSVRGNHDEIVLKEYFEFIDSIPAPTKWVAEWISQLTKEEVCFLSELPYTISIPSLKAIIIHAGLVPGIPLERNSPLNMVTMRNLIIGDYFGGGGLQATKNDSNGEAWASLWGGPQHIYFGHDAKRMLQKEEFATGLDTGCLYGNYLTGIFIKGPNTGTLVQVKAKQVYRKPKQNLCAKAVNN